MKNARNTEKTQKNRQVYEKQIEYRKKRRAAHKAFHNL